MIKYKLWCLIQEHIQPLCAMASEPTVGLLCWLCKNPLHMLEMKRGRAGGSGVQHSAEEHKNQNQCSSHSCLDPPGFFTHSSPWQTSLSNLFKGVVKCVICLSWWADVSPTHIRDAVCVTNGCGPWQPEQTRGRGRDVGAILILGWWRRCSGFPLEGPEPDCFFREMN